MCYNMHIRNKCFNSYTCYKRNNSYQGFNKERAHMTETARELRNKYVREWNAKNKDKVKATQKRYWEKKAAQAAQAQAASMPPAVEA